MSAEAAAPAEDDTALQVPAGLDAMRNRSPHPYRLRSGELQARNVASAAAAGGAATPELLGRPFARSPSDSGTEADDEKPLLKALTAPPLRPRKGLKGSKLSDVDFFDVSSTAEYDGSASAAAAARASGRAERWRRAGGGKAPREDGAVSMAAYRKRRRRVVAESIRRVMEGSLLALIAWLCLRNSTGIAGSRLILHFSLVAAMYLPKGLQTLKLVNASLRGTLRDSRLGNFDPAPFLYPAVIPLCVTACVSSGEQQVLCNLILSLCSMPIKGTPFADPNVLWLVSLLPLTYDQIISRSLWRPQGIADFWSYDRLSLLFPLHRALTASLKFLVTSSLLRTELQLLSISLINLLFFSYSPTAVILKALLLIGGLLMYAACKSILRWAVVLARIPRWKFRRIDGRVFRHRSFMRALDSVLGGLISSRLLREQKIYTSGSEDEGLSYLRKRVPASGRRASLGEGSKTPEAHIAHANTFPINDEAMVVDGSGQPSSPRRRRHTLPTLPTSLIDIPGLTRSASIGISTLRNPQRSFMRLTMAQAIVLRWFYAFYTYFMTIFLILVPVRMYVGGKALNGFEPIGWAVGYLFGNWPQLRYKLIIWSLDSWIPLPDRAYDYKDCPGGWADCIRVLFIGEANTRLLISCHCLIGITVGLAIVFRLSDVADVDTRRKVFHGMMVYMFLHTIYIDPIFVALAFTIVLTIFLLLDLYRASQLPPLSRPLTIFLTPYVDGRDHRGPVIISHIFLLIGCAIPLWLSLAGAQRQGWGALKGWEVNSRDVGMTAGVICVGMGDAAASLIGRRFGRIRWIWSGGKSIEGSLAFTAAVTMGLAYAKGLAVLGGWESWDWQWGTLLAKILLASSGASLTEAMLTGANDNVLVPVVLWLLVKGLHI